MEIAEEELQDLTVVCRSSIISLQCDENQFLEVTAVNYGAKNTCFNTCNDEDCLANTLEVIEKVCNSRNSCEFQDTDSVWDHFLSVSSTSEDTQEGTLELEIHLDVTYHCLASYVLPPESSMSELFRYAQD